MHINYSTEVTDGTVSGVISGLLVALTLGLLERTSQPRLELRQINDKTALLRNNGFRTVAFGETYALEKGNELLYPMDGFRGHISDMRCAGRSEIVVGCAIRLGESVDLTYKPIYLCELLPGRVWLSIQNEAQQATVMDVVGRTAKPWWTFEGMRSRLAKTTPSGHLPPVRLKGWELAHLPLKPM